MIEQHRLDLAGEDLFTAGVHDSAEPPQQLDGAVASRASPVARHRIAPTLDRRERCCGLLRVTVIPVGKDAAESEDAEGAGFGLDLVVVLIEQNRVGGDHELRGKILHPLRDAERVRPALARREHVDDRQVAELVQAPLDIVAESHTRTEDRVDVREAASGPFRGIRQRQSERVARNNQAGRAVDRCQPKRFVDVHVCGGVQHDGATEGECAHRGRLGGAVQEWREREGDDRGRCRVDGDTDCFVEVSRGSDVDKTPSGLLTRDEERVQIPHDGLGHASGAAGVEPQLGASRCGGRHRSASFDDVGVRGGARDRLTAIVDRDDLDGILEPGNGLERHIAERRRNEQHSRIGVDEESAHFTGAIAVVDCNRSDAGREARPGVGEVLRAVVQQHRRRVADPEPAIREMPRERAGFGREAAPGYGFVPGDDGGPVRDFSRDPLPQVAVVRRRHVVASSRIGGPECCAWEAKRDRHAASMPSAVHPPSEY